MNILSGWMLNLKLRPALVSFGNGDSIVKTPTASALVNRTLTLTAPLEGSMRGFLAEQCISVLI